MTCGYAHAGTSSALDRYAERLLGRVLLLQRRIGMPIAPQPIYTNCPQHIPQRLEAAEVERLLEQRDRRIAELDADIARLQGREAASSRSDSTPVTTRTEHIKAADMAAIHSYSRDPPTDTIASNFLWTHSFSGVDPAIRN